MLCQSVIVLNNIFSVHQRNSLLSWSAVMLNDQPYNLIIANVAECSHSLCILHLYCTFQGFVFTFYLQRLVPDIYSFLFILEGKKQREHLCPIKLVAAGRMCSSLPSDYYKSFHFIHFCRCIAFLLGALPCLSMSLALHLNLLTKDRLKLFKYLSLFTQMLIYAHLSMGGSNSTRNQGQAVLKESSSKFRDVK